MTTWRRGRMMSAPVSAPMGYVPPGMSTIAESTSGRAVAADGAGVRVAMTKAPTPAARITSAATDIVITFDFVGGRRSFARVDVVCPPETGDAPVSARAISPAFWIRSSGLVARHASTSSSSTGGTSLRSARSGCGGPASRFISTAVGVGPVNGGSPASISYIITPSA